MSPGGKNQLSSLSSGSQQNQAHSGLLNSLSADDKNEPKENTSKSGKRFNYGSSGRQYQVFYLVELFVRLFIFVMALLVVAVVAAVAAAASVIINYISFSPLVTAH